MGISLDRQYELNQLERYYDYINNQCYQYWDYTKRNTIRRNGVWYIKSKISTGREPKDFIIRKSRCITLLLPNDNQASDARLWIKSQQELLEKDPSKFNSVINALKNCPWNKSINPSIGAGVLKYDNKYIVHSEQFDLRSKNRRLKIDVFKFVNIEYQIKFFKEWAFDIYKYEFGNDFLSLGDQMLIGKIIDKAIRDALEIYADQFGSNIGFIGCMLRNEQIMYELRRFGFPLSSLWKKYRYSVDVNYL